MCTPGGKEFIEKKSTSPQYKYSEVGRGSRASDILAVGRMMSFFSLIALGTSPFLAYPPSSCSGGKLLKDEGNRKGFRVQSAFKVITLNGGKVGNALGIFLFIISPAHVNLN